MFCCDEKKVCVCVILQQLELIVNILCHFPKYLQTTVKSTGEL